MLISVTVNMQTVSSILGEAEFYHATALANACMFYLSCNLETALDSHYLDDLERETLVNLSEYCQGRQAEKSPIARSGLLIDELMVKHSDWIANLDLPRPSSARRKWRPIPKSPRLSPAGFSTSLPSPQLLPTPLPPVSQESSLQFTSISPDLSPSLIPISDIDEALFTMDDLELGSNASSSNYGSPRLGFVSLSPETSTHSPTLRPTTPLSRSPVWRMPAISSPEPANLRSIMAVEEAVPRFEKATPSRTPTRIPTKSPSHSPLPNSPPPPSNNLFTPTKSPSPWRPVSIPMWRVAEASKVSLTAVQAEQLDVSVTKASSPIRPNNSPRVSSFGSPVTKASSSSTLVPRAVSSPPANPASAMGAPVIKPVRGTPTAKPRLSNAPSNQEVPWSNYGANSNHFAPTSFEVEPVTWDSSSGASFADIQNQQQRELDFIRDAKKNTKSLADIQAEESFLQWWAKNEVNEDGPTSPSRDQSNSRGRGRGRGRENRGRGGRQNSGRGDFKGDGKSRAQNGPKTS